MFSASAPAPVRLSRPGISISDSPPAQQSIAVTSLSLAHIKNFSTMVIKSYLLKEFGLHYLNYLKSILSSSQHPMRKFLLNLYVSDELSKIRINDLYIPLRNSIGVSVIDTLKRDVDSNGILIKLINQQALHQLILELDVIATQSLVISSTSYLSKIRTHSNVIDAYRSAPTLDKAAYTSAMLQRAMEYSHEAILLYTQPRVNDALETIKLAIGDMQDLINDNSNDHYWNLYLRYLRYLAAMRNDFACDYVDQNYFEVALGLFGDAWDIAKIPDNRVAQHYTKIVVDNIIKTRFVFSDDTIKNGDIASGIKLAKEALILIKHSQFHTALEKTTLSVNFSNHIVKAYHTQGLEYLGSEDVDGAIDCFLKTIQEYNLLDKTYTRGLVNFIDQVRNHFATLINDDLDNASDFSGYQPFLENILETNLDSGIQVIVKKALMKIAQKNGIILMALGQAGASEQQYFRALHFFYSLDVSHRTVRDHIVFVETQRALIQIWKSRLDMATTLEFQVLVLTAIINAMRLIPQTYSLNSDIVDWSYYTNMLNNIKAEVVNQLLVEINRLNKTTKPSGRSGIALFNNQYAKLNVITKLNSFDATSDNSLFSMENTLNLFVREHPNQRAELAVVSEMLSQLIKIRCCETPDLLTRPTTAEVVATPTSHNSTPNSATPMAVDEQQTPQLSHISTPSSSVLSSINSVADQQDSYFVRSLSL
jgi:tetratricopeptide (TPR) repeat protein